MSKKLQRKSPIHVCSLSLSELTRASKELQEVTDLFNTMTDEDHEKDPSVKNNLQRLRCLNLSMEYNRQTQLQYVLNHLGNKEALPKIRPMKMRPVFRAWKREILRQRWQQINGILTLEYYQNEIGKKKQTFAEQRAQVSSKQINAQLLPTVPITDLIPVSGLECIDNFQLPSDQKIIAAEEVDYRGTSAVKTFTQYPTTEEGNELSPELLERLRARGIHPEGEEYDDFAEYMRERGIKPDKNGKILSGAERATRTYKKAVVETKSKGLSKMIAIASVIIILLAVFVFFFRGTGTKPEPAAPDYCEQFFEEEDAKAATATPVPKVKKSAHKATPTASPTPTTTAKAKGRKGKETPTPTPTPTPKKGWFK